MRIATERAAACVWIRAVLDGKREHDRGVPGVRVGGTVRFMIREEKLADSAVREARDAGGVAQSGDLELERDRRASAREAFASSVNHRASPRWTFRGNALTRARTTVLRGRCAASLRQAREFDLAGRRGAGPPAPVGERRVHCAPPTAPGTDRFVLRRQGSRRGLSLAILPRRCRWCSLSVKP